MQLAGRVAIVTGASRGLGAAIAAQLVGEGADIMLVARAETRLGQLVDELRLAKRVDAQRLSFHAADVSQPEQVEQVVSRTLHEFGRIDVLVCNAGVQGPIGRLEDLTWQEWVRTIEINLFGTVLCCRAVLPTMRLQRRGKIVLLSGGGATRGRARFTAYAASKSAVVRFAETLAQEVHGTGIDVNAVAPGTLDTDLLDEVVKAGPERAGEAEIAAALKHRAAGATLLQVPASLVAFLASSESDGISGRLLSAVWDRWADLPALREKLSASDIYTLRRIEPADRGWDVA